MKASPYTDFMATGIMTMLLMQIEKTYLGKEFLKGWIFHGFTCIKSNQRLVFVLFLRNCTLQLGNLRQYNMGGLQRTLGWEVHMGAVH